MEKVFKARWWDYHNRKFNINGRICLETLLPFGIAGTVLLKWANPCVLGILEKVPSNILNSVLIILVTLIVIDTIISFVVIGNFKRTAKQVEKEIAKDSTEEISNMVKEVTIQKAEEIKKNMTEKVEEFRTSTTQRAEKIKESVKLNIKVASEKVEKSQKNIQNVIYNRITTTKEFTETVKERFSNTWLNRRLLRAFPNIQVKSKIFKLIDDREQNSKKK